MSLSIAAESALDVAFLSDNRHFQTPKTISVLSVVKNCASIWKFVLLYLAFCISSSARVGIAMSFLCQDLETQRSTFKQCNLK